MDHITQRGLPEGQVSLVSGTAGSARMVFGCQFLGEGIQQFEEAGGFETLEEEQGGFRPKTSGLGMDVTKREDLDQLFNYEGLRLSPV